MNPHLLFAAATSCFLVSGLASADTITASSSLSATVQPTGPRTGTSGTNFFNIEAGGNNNFASFGVLDFTTSSFNLAFPVTAVSTLTLSLTESNTSFTTASGGLAFYLVTDTTTSIANDGTSPLVYQTGASVSPQGLGTQLGATPFLLGIGSFSTNSGSSGSGTVDTYSFTLQPDAQAYLLNQLNSSGSTIRLAVVTTDPVDSTKASTWAGSTNSNAATRPLLSLAATLDQPSLTWVGGNGTWNATGGTDWSGGAWDSAKTAVFSTGSGIVALGTPVTALGVTFHTGGYTVSGSGANVLTLASAAGGNTITVTNAADIATISAEIAGTTGLVKSGSGTLALIGSNSFTGDVAINTGTLAVNSDAALGNAANGIVLNTGTLKTLAPVTTARKISGSGILDSSAGDLVLNGVVDAAGLTVASNSHVTFAGPSVGMTTLAIGANSTATLNSPLTGTVHTVISGDGTAELNADNSSFVGGFRMDKGGGTVGPTVVMSSNKSLGDTQLFLNAGVLKAATAMTGANAITTSVSYGGSATIDGADMEFTGGFTFFGSTPKTLTVNNHTTISTDLGTAVYSTLVKAGTGTLTLGSTNSYVGGTQITAGTLQVTLSGALGTSDVILSAGAFLDLDSETSIDDASNLFLLSSGGSFATLDLNFDGSLFETVHALSVDGVFLAPGTYNAANLPDYITGTGNLTVVAVPEPQVTLLLLFGGLALAMSKPIRSRLSRKLKS